MFCCVIAHRSCYRIGRKSTKLVRAAALKLSQEIAALIDRPPYTNVSRALEG